MFHIENQYQYQQQSLQNSQIGQQKLTITKQISEAFPDIQGQLCSRHSSLLSQLKAQFQRLYGMEPSHFIIVKGKSILYEPLSNLSTQSPYKTKIQMGLQNGHIFLLKTVNPPSQSASSKKQVFINGNNFSSQIILQPSGNKIIQLTNTINNGQLNNYTYYQKYAEQISKYLGLATEDLSKNKMNGGIILTYSNIPENKFNYEVGFGIGMYLTFLVMNENYNFYEINEIIKKLNNLNPNIFKKEQMKDYFKSMKNRQLIFQFKNQEQKIPIILERKEKLLFCKVQQHFDELLSIQEKQQYQQNKKLITYRVQKALTYMRKEFNHKSIEDFYLSSEGSQFLLNSQISQEIQQEKSLLFWMLQEFECLSEYSNQKIQFAQLIKRKWQIQSKKMKIWPQKIVQKIDNLIKDLKLKACQYLPSQGYLLVVSDKYNHTQMLRKLKKSLFTSSQRDFVSSNKKWGNDPKIYEKIFTSVPSKGVSILCPQQQIWFE